MHLLTFLFGVVFSVGLSQAGDKCEICYVTDCCVDPSFNGLRNIKTQEGRIFSAYCQEGWTYAFRRYNGAEDFYRTWVEYQHGFGNRYSEHFIGLDNLASFVKGRKCKVRFDLEAWPPASPVKGFAEYSIFKVADKYDKYRLTIGGYRGTVNDSMSYHSGQQFSTYDQDNDMHPGGNCASNGAWWHNWCYHTTLFGSYGEKKVGLRWILWPNKKQTLKKASMKIYCC